MKSYTDLEQSKKLAEILPVESADMCYRAYREEGGIPDYQATLCPYQFASWIGVPCWSLAALIGLLPNGTILKKSDNGRYFIGGLLYDELLDVCVDKIIELKEIDLL